ncbi:DUF523 domain-containing protein [Pseudodesulfovibrio thermohalotolerans]|uniref:DUF523 domain-containing protein n=1 Tax=Pseudodesulfovibrio thermohalotolerans TaxID=2880651 RepID=UPI0022B9D8A8|nr:DUF523 domain-containing protein [Pseudodesulfovibrio thermohalotolerans]WFS62850.1 DUF523 domain-containing protein [Pseudodesulfovibrio thermohalotolerans]
MKDAPIIVSACLAGIYCRYNGEAQPFEPVVNLIRRGRAIPFCPEAFGGLPTPRRACEILGDRVVDADGVDRTAEFRRGAEEGLRLARLAGCREAILKARSPSCGSGEVYDGTFSSTRVPGDGVFARLLKENGIAVRTEEDLAG